MGRSHESFNKKEVRNKKDKKRKDKEKKKLAKKDDVKDSSLENMMAYVDENGMISATPPDPSKKKKISLDDIEISIPRRENVESDPIRKGILTFYNDSKGYGFIRDLETKESIFVHVSELLEEVKEGNQVIFEIQKGPKGLTAVQVKVLK